MTLRCSARWPRSPTRSLVARKATRPHVVPVEATSYHVPVFSNELRDRAERVHPARNAIRLSPPLARHDRACSMSDTARTNQALGAEPIVTARATARHGHVHALRARAARAHGRRARRAAVPQHRRRADVRRAPGGFSAGTRGARLHAGARQRARARRGGSCSSRDKRRPRSRNARPASASSSTAASSSRACPAHADRRDGAAQRRILLAGSRHDARRAQRRARRASSSSSSSSSSGGAAGRGPARGTWSCGAAWRSQRCRSIATTSSSSSRACMKRSTAGKRPRVLATEHDRRRKRFPMSAYRRGWRRTAPRWRSSR